MSELMEIPTLERRLKLLKKENKVLKAEVDRAYGTRQSIYIRHLLKENKALRQYAQHRIGCEYFEGKACDCGLDALLVNK